MRDQHSAPVIQAAQNKRCKQLGLTVFFSFVLPLVLIVGIVYDLTQGDKGASKRSDSEAAIMARIQKVGSINFGSGQRSARTGEEVFKIQCSACHSAGLVGAPKLGDATAWAPRIKTGFDALLNSALKGKNAMAPQGGGAFDSVEIGRAVAYMANAAGARFEEPKAAATSAPASAAAPGK